MAILTPSVRDVAVTSPEADGGQATATHLVDSQVYDKMVHWLSPRLIQMLESAQDLGKVNGKSRLAKTRAHVLYRQACAAAALAWHCEKLTPGPQRAAMQSHVRMWLNHWQRTLRPNGLPVCQRHRQSPYLGAIAGQIVQLLDQTNDFETPSLTSDLVAHLSWLADRPTRICWLEAASICALADGFFVLRETKFRDAARRRLEAFMALQKSEGWFPERGGADMGRHALTLDALARMHQQLNWVTLGQPIARGMAFAGAMVHPDGTTGGVYSACQTGFTSPYAMECMATVSADAAKMSAAYRLRLSQLEGQHLMSWHDDMCAVLASRFALAGELNRKLQPQSFGGQDHQPKHVHFPQAGLIVHHNRHYHVVVAYKFGGAVHLTWAGHEHVLSDPGIAVSFAHRSRSATGWQPGVHVDIADDAVDISGVLGKCPSDRSPRRSRLRRLWRQRRGKTNARLILPPRPSQQSRAIDYDRLAHDHYQRRIEFLEDGIRIVDQLHCRLRCESATLHAAVHARANQFVDRAGAASSSSDPIIVEGGRHLQITRTYRHGVLVEAQ